jgi:hypothetical protein
MAQALGIDYVYVDALDRDRHPAVEKFDAHPEVFQRVFKRGAVAVYEVH